MKLGMVGLGRMGSSMVERLRRHGHAVVGLDVDEARVREAVAVGAEGVDSVEALVAALPAPRAVWVMVPHGEPTSATLRGLLPRLAAGDVVVDGGNSHYRESIEHAEACRARGLLFLDVGVSGGVWGLELGYNLMVGGPREAFARLEPVLRSLAPPHGYAHVGPSGSGHFVKMVHNGLEYAMLGALGEAFECLASAPWPLDLERVAALWQEGAVVRCWLLDLLGRAFQTEGQALEKIGARIDDSGTGRWTAEFAVTAGIPLPLITQALYERFASQDDGRYAHRIVAALRHQFGGHAMARAGVDGPSASAR